MQSNYKRLGDFIREVDIRNIGLQVSNLVGLSISKQFIPSVANTIGTDMEKYKILKKNQFACSIMQVRRDKKMPVALWNKDEPAIISQAYPVFEIKRTDLLPEYLMMWFSREEFDREACFKAVGGVRGSLEWGDFLDMELPVPSLEKQQAIVEEYNTIERRMELNNKLIEKLEETAQTLYKHWFVDFEFPNEEGKPYKSSGGKMVYNEELEKEIPEEWKIVNLEDVSNCLDYKRKPLSKEERDDMKGHIPYYGAMAIVDYIDEYIYDGIYILFSEDGVNIVDENGYPALQYVWGKFWLNNHAHILEGKGNVSNEFLYCSLKKINVSHLITGAAQPKINQNNMNQIRILNPSPNILLFFDQKVSCIFQTYRNRKSQNKLFTICLDLLLSRLATLE